MDSLERLSALFGKFPGIGPRQAGRFVQYLLRSSPTIRRELIDAIQSMGSDVHQCIECMRYQSSNKKTCSICSNPERDPRLLAVVATDTDVMALERSHTYRGKYFVIGGTVSLASEKVHNLRIRELVDALGTRIENNLSEIILAFPANPEGDATETIVREALDPFRENLTITSLGRGLSTGSELEYADPTTLKNALDNRR